MERVMTNYIAAVKAGRCWNGAHRDRGVVVHAVPSLGENCSGAWFDKALCGSEPGRRSYGWDNSRHEINCPKCLKKIELLATDKTKTV